MDGTFLVFGSRNHAKSGMQDNIKVRIPFNDHPVHVIEDSIKIPSGNTGISYVFITVVHRQWCTESKRWEVYCYTTSSSLDMLKRL